MEVSIDRPTTVRSNALKELRSHVHPRVHDASDGEMEICVLVR